MFSRKSIILLLISIHCLIDIASTGKIQDKLKSRVDSAKKGIGIDGKGDKPAAEQKVSKAPNLNPDQIEFSKKFFKNLNDDQKKGEQGIPLNYSKPMRVEKGTKIAENHNIEVVGDDGEEKTPPPEPDDAQQAPQNQPSPGGIGTYKSMPSGGLMFMDGLMNNFVPIGDPFGGMPDSIFSLAKWCVEIFIKGVLLIIFSIIRWPHKIFVKLVFVTGAIAWIPTTLMWCLNPISIARIVGKNKIVNNAFEDLADLQYKLKVRLANVIDKVYNLRELQKLTCCMYMDWRDSSVRAVDDNVKEFLMNWFHSFVKLITIVYCGDYNDGTDECKKVEFDDSEPLRVIPRSHVTLWVEMFTKFF